MSSNFMGFVISILITIYIWSITAITLIISTTIMLLISPFAKEKHYRFIFKFFMIKPIYYAVSYMGIWNIYFRNLKYIKPNTPYIIVSNHISFIDGFLLLLLPTDNICIIAKKFSRIPIFSWVTHKMGYISVAMEDKTTTKHAVAKICQKLKKGASLLVFAEGKRNPRPKKLLKFKTGAFRIAKNQDLQILPVCIHSSDTAHRIGSWLFHPSDINITISESYSIPNNTIDINYYVNETRNKIEKIYHEFLNNANKIQQK